MKTKTLTILLVIVGLLGAVPASFAQSTVPSMTATTLASAITTPTASQSGSTTIALSSIGSGTTAVVAGTFIVADMEVMRVTVTPTSATNVQVARGAQSTRATTHASGTIVYYGNPQAFVSGTPGQQFYTGSCTASNFTFQPVFDIVNGTLGRCTNSQWRWVRLAAPATSTTPYTPVSNANYTVLDTDYAVGVTTLTTGITITLPAAAGRAGRFFTIQDESGNAGTATATIYLSPTVLGSTDRITTGYGTITVKSNGTSWYKQ